MTAHRHLRAFLSTVATATSLVVGCRNESNQPPAPETQVPASGSCLPKIDVPLEWLACATDSDCAVAGDACRSCGPLVILNRRYVADFAKLDRELRDKVNCSMACEACTTRHITPTCKQGQCSKL